jgi:hypothetical protein
LSFIPLCFVFGHLWRAISYIPDLFNKSFLKKQTNEIIGVILLMDRDKLI